MPMLLLVLIISSLLFEDLHQQSLTTINVLEQGGTNRQICLIPERQTSGFAYSNTTVYSLDNLS